MLRKFHTISIFCYPSLYIENITFSPWEGRREEGYENWRERLKATFFITTTKTKGNKYSQFYPCALYSGFQCVLGGQKSASPFSFPLIIFLLKTCCNQKLFPSNLKFGSNFYLQIFSPKKSVTNKVSYSKSPAPDSQFRRYFSIADTLILNWYLLFCQNNKNQT